MIPAVPITHSRVEHTEQKIKVQLELIWLGKIRLSGKTKHNCPVLHPEQWQVYIAKAVAIWKEKLHPFLLPTCIAKQPFKYGFLAAKKRRWHLTLEVSLQPLPLHHVLPWLRAQNWSIITLMSSAFTQSLILTCNICSALVVETHLHNSITCAR